MTWLFVKRPQQRVSRFFMHCIDRSQPQGKVLDDLSFARGSHALLLQEIEANTSGVTYIILEQFSAEALLYAFAAEHAEFVLNWIGPEDEIDMRVCEDLIALRMNIEWVWPHKRWWLLRQGKRLFHSSAVVPQDSDGNNDLSVVNHALMCKACGALSLSAAKAVYYATGASCALFANLLSRNGIGSFHEHYAVNWRKATEDLELRLKEYYQSH